MSSGEHWISKGVEGVGGLGESPGWAIDGGKGELLVLVGMGGTVLVTRLVT
jgi:hypothetical protein